jgi:hypothetical protein
MDYNTEAGQFLINQKNVKYACIYFAVRKCIQATWLNDHDQFLMPNDGWRNDTAFHNDCLVYTLFSNNIQSQYGINHWIPFSEKEVKAKTSFQSNFMSKYIAGKIDTEVSFDLFNKVEKSAQNPLVFSAQAQATLNVARELWTYYHTQDFSSLPNAEYNPNASLYDIRDFFQGRSTNGKMNTKSHDTTYILLITALREEIRLLSQEIEPKIYEYGFLKR